MNNIDKLFNFDAKAFSKSYFAYLYEVLSNIDVTEIERFAKTLLDARERRAMIFFIGNGGSAATASHFANDLAIGTRAGCKPFRVLSLTDNQAVITAVGNDYGYEDIFVKQIEVYSQEGDILVGISASGNSPNLIKAFEYANCHGLKTVALTAFDGGKLKKIAKEGIHVPTGPKEYGPAEDAHMILDHLLMAYLSKIIN